MFYRSIQVLLVHIKHYSATYIEIVVGANYNLLLNMHEISINVLVCILSHY